MTNETSFRRVIAISAFVSVVGIIASTIVLFMAVDYNVDLLGDLYHLIALDQNGATLFRWGSILELFNPSLLLVPVALYLWYWLKPCNSGLVTTYTVLGLASILAAAVGALFRATYFPPLMNAYAQASEAQRDLLAMIFQATIDFTFEGMLALEYLLWGVWWFGIGMILYRERRGLGIFTTVLGAAFLGAAAGWLLRVDSLARLEMVYLLLPIWLIWLGIIIWPND